MRSKSRALTAILVALTMLFSSLLLTATAYDNDYENDYEEENGNYTEYENDYDDLNDYEQEEAEEYNEEDLIEEAAEVAQYDLTVEIDGVTVVFPDQQPVIVDGRTLVPVRGVFEGLGFEVDWDDATQTATLVAERYVYSWMGELRIMAAVEQTYEINITIGSDVFTVNEEEYELDVYAQLIGGRTMIPFRAVLEAVGHFVDWDGATNTVVVRNLWGHHNFEWAPNAMAYQLSEPSPGDKIAIVHTNHGEIHIRLFPELAPLAVENFVGHALAGYYDGLIFHRVINNFMIQGGCPQGVGLYGESIWDQPFGDEYSVNLRHVRGALSMANSGPMTNSSQFFIVQAPGISPLNEIALNNWLETQDEVSPWAGRLFSDVFPTELIEFYFEFGGTPHLDFGHSVFGQVFYGMDVVDAIAATETGEADRPVEDVIIETIEILIFGE